MAFHSPREHTHSPTDWRKSSEGFLGGSIPPECITGCSAEVARLPWKQEVAGSKPAIPIRLHRWSNWTRCLASNQVDAGSTPARCIRARQLNRKSPSVHRGIKRADMTRACSPS